MEDVQPDVLEGDGFARAKQSFKHNLVEYCLAFAEQYQVEVQGFEFRRREGIPEACNAFIGCIIYEAQRTKFFQVVAAGPRLHGSLSAFIGHILYAHTIYGDAIALPTMIS